MSPKGTRALAEMRWVASPVTQSWCGPKDGPNRQEGGSKISSLLPAQRCEARLRHAPAPVSAGAGVQPLLRSALAACTVVAARAFRYW